MTGPPLPRLKFYPVVVGINDYLHEQRIGRLDFAVRDAQRITAFLQAPNAVFETVPFEPLYNAHATAERVREQLRRSWNSMRLGAGDVLLFYFAGHGAVQRGQAFLFCFDVNPNDPNSGSLRLDDLYRDMQHVSAQTAFVILDACHSGAMLAPEVVNHNPAQQMSHAIRQTLLTQGNSIVMAAAHADQKAREQPYLQLGDGVQGGGVFTDAILRGWRDGAARNTNGLVTPESLAGYLNNEFPALPNQQPITSLTVGSPLVLGRFTPPTAGEGIPVPPPAPTSRGLIDRTLSGTPVSPASPPALSPARMANVRRWAIAGGSAIAALAVCGLLVVVSPFFYSIAFATACLLCVISIPVAGRAAGLATALSIIQAVLLVGAAQSHFGLLRGFEPLSIIAGFGWAALVIFAIQTLVVLYRAADAIASD